ncbi:putative sporulation protein YtxC [Thermaerobacillus caldiproteolyticus]|uniref:putative sporulation protein YtxC n=1 Tax=Thermaerobacillus caldiproteolyticus TaxID=247480 RepID=UPI0018F11B03|nr:putative sporulation protein YtxC [Anoxybacillus caldiproteolyticus]
MIEIYFEQANDAEKLFHVLKQKQQHEKNRLFQLAYTGDSRVTIYIQQNLRESISRFLIPSITQFILRFIEDRLLLSIISGTFYFKDEEEQQQILQLAHSFIDGERYDYRCDHERVIPRETLIEEALLLFLKDDLSFSFESFVKFRLKLYIERLQHYVELAIDEYKLEQEYQNFVQMLRDCVQSRQSKLSAIHLVHQPPGFVFYDEKFRKITLSQLKQLIDRNLIISQPMYVDSSVLAPLVSIAPQNIYLYTTHEDDGMVQTIQNVFQERIQLCHPVEFGKNGQGMT